MPTRTSQTPPSTRAWHDGRGGVGLGAVPAAGCPDGEQAGAQRRHPGPQVLDDRQHRLEGAGVAVGVGRQQQQLGAPGLGVAAALPAAYALGPGGAVAHLDDVGVQHGGGGARRPLGLLERGDHRPVGAPHHHHPHRTPHPRSAAPDLAHLSGSTRCTPGQVRSARCGGRAPRWTTTRARRSPAGPAPAVGPLQADSSTLSRASDPRPVAVDDQHRGARAQPRVEDPRGPLVDRGGRAQHHHPEHVDQRRRHLQPVLAGVGHQHRARQLDPQLGRGLRPEVGAPGEADPLPGREAPAARASASDGGVDGVGRTRRAAARGRRARAGWGPARRPACAPSRPPARAAARPPTAPGRARRRSGRRTSAHHRTGVRTSQAERAALILPRGGVTAGRRPRPGPRATRPSRRGAAR